MRSLVALAFALHLSVIDGAASLTEDEACTQRCDDDDADGRCAPDCADCACCSHSHLTAIGVESKSSLPGELPRIPERVQIEPTSPEPDDILHVPRSRFA